jgi:endonuclease YncB( thermonuclease family)
MSFENKYFGQVLRVIDGDTFEVLIDLGFGVSQKFSVRLDGIDTPETTTSKGKQAKEFVKDLIEGKTVILTDCGNEKYGRARASIQLSDGKDLTQLLIEREVGKEYHGGKKQFFSMSLI